MDTKTRGEGGFWRGRLGALLGAALLTAVGFSITAAAQQLTTLYTFTGGDRGTSPKQPDRRPGGQALRHDLGRWH